MNNVNCICDPRGIFVLNNGPRLYRVAIICVGTNLGSSLISGPTYKTPYKNAFRGRCICNRPIHMNFNLQYGRCEVHTHQKYVHF